MTPSVNTDMKPDSKFSHHEQRTARSSTVWLTPKFIIDALGSFDLDPCHQPDGQRPFNTATRHYCEAQDGLSLRWTGTVWLNPPYLGQQGAWIDRMIAHGDGIALLPFRPETAVFRAIWENADVMLVLQKRIHYLYPDGSPAAANSGHTSVLVAFGETCATRLFKTTLPGVLLSTWRVIGGSDANN